MTSGSSRSRSQYQSSTRVSPCMVSSVGRRAAIGGVSITPKPDTATHRVLWRSLRCCRTRSVDAVHLLEGDGKHVAYVVGEMELHLGADLLGHIVEIGSVASGQHNLGETCPVSSQDLLLDTTDR